MMNGSTHIGILNVDKPSGCTSHDVVARVRRLSGTRRVGHAGTLDPLATGVLLVCIGQATRVSEYLLGGVKIYVATVRLGVETDTLDIDGQILRVQDVPELSEATIDAALRPFVGSTMQVPPAFSAIKQGGAPVYRKARRGEPVDLPARPVRIHSITLLHWRSPELLMEIVCDPGTYVRSLGRDLGDQLGCGATLTALRRTRSGSFAVEDAVPVELLEDAARSQRLHEHLSPIASAFASTAIIHATSSEVMELVHGRPIAIEHRDPLTILLALDDHERAVAVLAYRPETDSWWPNKVFTGPADQGQVE